MNILWFHYCWSYCHFASKAPKAPERQKRQSAKSPKAPKAPKRQKRQEVGRSTWWLSWLRKKSAIPFFLWTSVLQLAVEPGITLLRVQPQTSNRGTLAEYSVLALTDSAMTMTVKMTDWNGDYGTQSASGITLLPLFSYRHFQMLAFSP